MPLGQLTTPSAGLFPEFEHFEVFAGARPDAQYRHAPALAPPAPHFSAAGLRNLVLGLLIYPSLAATFDSPQVLAHFMVAATLFQEAPPVASAPLLLVC